MNFSIHLMKLLVVACFALATQPASAVRPVEEEIFNAPMPHESLGPGEKVRVHYTSVRSHLEPTEIGATLSALKQDVATCVKTLGKGKKANPPTAWPEDGMFEVRLDTYYAVNRSVTYSTGVGFWVKADDCSLYEIRKSKVGLLSNKGRCVIDIDRKTAKGVCDDKAHANAPLDESVPTSPGADEAVIKKMLANPATAPMAAALQKGMTMMAVKTGQKKKVHDIECEVVVSGPGHPIKATYCISRAGSFVPSAGASGYGYPGVVLEGKNFGNTVWKTQQVKLDVDVNEKVFAPYLQGGFTIENRKGFK